MSGSIRAIYTAAPGFAAAAQHPDAVRYFGYTAPVWAVDAVGGQPTQAEVDAIMSPTQDAKGALAVDAGDRLQFEIEYDQECRLRVLEAKPAITRVQYRNALIATWKTLNP